MRRDFSKLGLTGRVKLVHPTETLRAQSAPSPLCILCVTRFLSLAFLNKTTSYGPLRGTLQWFVFFPYFRADI